MKTLTVLILTNRFPPDAEGGYENSCALVVRALRDRGHRVVIVTRRRREMRHEEDVHRILFDRNSANRGLMLTGPVFEALDVARFRQVLGTAQPDVVYVWGATGLSVRVLAEASRALPTVIYVADYWLADWLSGARLPDGYAHQVRALATRQLVASPSVSRTVNRAFSVLDSRMHRQRIAASPWAVQFDSQHMAEDVASRGIALANAKVIPHAIDVHQFRYRSPLDRQQTAPSVLYVGRVVPPKGVETLVRAMPLVRSVISGVTLTLVGAVEPAYARLLNELILSLGLEDSVFLLGSKAQEQLVPIYESHSVLAFPSEWDEPFGIVLLEAMASGLPVVSSGAGGSCEIVTDGENGLVFKRGDSTDLAEKLSKVLRSTTLCTHLAERARSTVERRYDLALMLDHVEADLTEAVGMGMPSPR